MKKLVGVCVLLPLKISMVQSSRACDLRKRIVRRRRICLIRKRKRSRVVILGKSQPAKSKSQPANTKVSRIIDRPDKRAMVTTRRSSDKRMVITTLMTTLKRSSDFLYIFSHNLNLWASVFPYIPLALSLSPTINHLPFFQRFSCFAQGIDRRQDIRQKIRGYMT